MGKLIRSVLVTGFPGRQPAVHLVRELANRGERSVCCLVTEGRQERAMELLDALPESARERVSIWLGDPRSMDLGLSGEEFAVLAEGVEVIHHCASIADPAATKEEAAGNVRAAAEILELAEAAPRLKRLVSPGQIQPGQFHTLARRVIAEGQVAVTDFQVIETDGDLGRSANSAEFTEYSDHSESRAGRTEARHLE